MAPLLCSALCSLVQSNKNNMAHRVRTKETAGSHRRLHETCTFVLCQMIQGLVAEDRGEFFGRHCGETAQGGKWWGDRQLRNRLFREVWRKRNRSPPMRFLVCYLLAADSVRKKKKEANLIATVGFWPSVFWHLRLPLFCLWSVPFSLMRPFFSPPSSAFHRVNDKTSVIWTLGAVLQHRLFQAGLWLCFLTHAYQHKHVPY